MIKLDEVTWYSQIVAIIFGAIIFGIGFYTGIEHHPQTTLNENDFEVPYMLEFCGGTYSTNQIKLLDFDITKAFTKIIDDDASELCDQILDQGGVNFSIREGYIDSYDKNFPYLLIVNNNWEFGLSLPEKTFYYISPAGYGATPLKDFSESL